MAFPATTRDMLLVALSGAPRLLKGIVDRAPAGDPAWDRPVPGRFTAREHVAHLADWETVYLDRFARTLAEDVPTLLNYDETERAAEQGYSSADPTLSASVFAERRVQTVSFLRTVPEDRWARVGLHPQIGPMTLEVQVAHVAAHDGYHLEFLTANLP